jgi:phosphocarrier protein HPr
MISKDYQVLAPEGLHAWPAATFLKAAKKFKSVITIKKGDAEVYAKSILAILTLAIKCGETISVIIDGTDEEEASKAMDVLFLET